MPFARSLWVRIETLHAVTYFGEETQAAAADAGLTGFWSGYFALRAAPLGPVEPGVVEATFSNFAPSFVRRWVPAIWRGVEPADLLDRRAAAAAATLRRVAPEVEQLAHEVGAVLQAAIDHGTGAGRPLFAANRDVALPADPVAALWQRCTALREHRGDGHVAALTAAGVDGLEAHILISAEQGTDPGDLQRTRGWTAGDWTAATDRLAERGLLDEDGRLTPLGQELRASVEATTDRLAAAPFASLGETGRADLLRALTPAASVVSGAGVIRYPNPMGLPPLT